MVGKGGSLTVFDRDKIVTDASKCPLRGYLSKCDCECGDDCLEYFKFSLYAAHSNIPKNKIRYNTIDLSKCSKDAQNIINGILNDPVTLVKNGLSLYLHGDTGVGKTTLGIKILLNYFYHKCMDSIPDNECRGIFIPVDELIEYHRYHKDDPDFTDNIQIVKDCDLVVFDNLFATGYTKYGHEIVDSVIRYRVLHEKSNIYTSNITLDDAYNDFQMIASLCGENAISIHIVGDDHRISDVDIFKTLFGGDQ